MAADRYHCPNLLLTRLETVEIAPIATRSSRSCPRLAVIMSIAGDVSRQMLSRYAHIRTEAKREALEDVDRKRKAARAQSLEKRQKQAAAEAQAAPQIQ